MKYISLLLRWVEAWLRARRFARDSRPFDSGPSWIRAAESFSILDANPMASIPAAKIGWIEAAGDSSRLLSRYSLELQQAAESFEESRSRLLDNKLARDVSAFSDSTQFGAIERQRRALSLEREAICLLAHVLRVRYARLPVAQKAEGFPSLVDKPQILLKGMTLLAYFVAIRRLDAVERLIEAGAAPEAPCLDGSCALSVASRKAEAYAGAPACGAAIQASCILAVLEARSLMGHVGEPAWASKPKVLRL